MLLKILGGIFICFGTWFLGKNVSESYRQKIEIIEKYVAFLKNFRSNVTFSGLNIYEFLKKCKEPQNLITYLLEKKDTIDIKNFKGSCIEEEKCADIISEALSVASTSSDTLAIADFIDEALLKLLQYKKEYLEECYGKIRIAPKIGLIVGMFVAVLIL